MLEDLPDAEQAHGNVTGPNVGIAREIASVCHDVLTCHRERGYQAVGIFLLLDIVIFRLRR